MKALKLILIFAAFAGIIAAIIILSEPDGSDNISTGDKQQNFEKLKKEIVERWNVSEGWNQNMYDSLKNKIQSYETNHFITAQDAGTLRTTLKENSVNKMCSLYDTSLAHLKRISADANLIQNYDGLMYIQNDQKLTEDTRINNVSSTHKLYLKAKKFVRSSPHYNDPYFDSYSDPMWKSLASYQSAAVGEANIIKGNSLYAKMKHVEDFVSGLNSDNIDNIFANAKSSYYNSLKSQIKDHFQGIYNNGSVTNNDIDNLKKAISAYKSEFGSDAELMQLKNDYDDFLSYKNHE